MRIIVILPPRMLAMTILVCYGWIVATTPASAQKEQTTPGNAAQPVTQAAAPEPTMVLAQTETAPATYTDGSVEVRQKLLYRLRTLFPGLRSSVMLEFYRTNNPGVLDEFEHKCSIGTKAGERYLKQMAERFLELEHLRTSSPAEFRRAVELDRMETEARRVGRDISQLRDAVAAADATGNGDESVEARKILQNAEKELRRQLEKIFTQTQENQLDQIILLENEIKKFRDMLGQREADREKIIEEQFLIYTNPSGKQPGTAGTTNPNLQSGTADPAKKTAP